MFQYFLKVVSTQFRTLDGKSVRKICLMERNVDSLSTQINTHQYSVTHFERDLMKGTGEEDRQGVYTHHGFAGAPGTRFKVAVKGLLSSLHRRVLQL